MTRYGEGSERFGGSEARWRGGLAQYEEMLRKEQAVTEAARSTAGFESQSARSASEAARARRESADLAERQAAASERSAQSSRLEAEAIRESARAREQANLTSATGRRPPNVLRGALDPLVNDAYRLIDQNNKIPSQYALRNNLGIGSYRARDLQEALAAGSAPAGATPYGVRQAQIEEVKADQKLATATRDLTNIRRRASATDADIAAALTARDLAKANVAAARERTRAAEEDAAAHQRSVEAIRAETASRERAAVSASESTALAVRREFIPGALGGGPTEGQTQVFAPRSQPTRHPTNIQEVNPYATGTPGVNEAQSAERANQARALGVAELNAQRQAAGFAGQALQSLEEREIAVASATNRAAVIQRLYSDEMHRHGALTAEFIQATARGEVTLREFGNEMLVTIGKFAGWTAAATAVYGAFRVISDIKTGAVGAQSAVEGLTRFIDPLNQQKAYQGVLGLSRQTNVPVQDVGDVAQVFARRFNNPQTGLKDTLTATRTALLAYKLDNISTADSTRFLMAITQEWQISAQRLPSLFDQISAGQRRFGARVAETLPALARSSAAVKNQGGDLNQLLALLSLAQVRSGQTGAVVGQAFTRSASNFFRRPDNVAVERRYGLNPEEGYTQFLIDAIKKAQTLNGRQRAELGRAIGGPAFGARIFQTLLNAPEAQLNRFIRGTSPATTRGSAAQEFAKVLGQANEQLAKIGITLQNIGGRLAQSGLLTFAGVLLHGLNGALGGLETLLRLFSELPRPLTTTLGLLGEIAVTMRLLGRFGVSQRLQGIPIAGALINPGQRLRQQATNDQHAIVEASRRQLEADSANALTVRRSQQRSLDRARPLATAAATELQAGVADPRRRAALQAYLVGLEAQAASQQEAALLAERDVEVSKVRLADEEANLAAIKAANARTIEATLAQRGLTVTPLRGATPAGEVPTPVTGSQFLRQMEGPDGRGAIVTNTANAERAKARMQRTLIGATPVLARMGRTGELLDAAAGRTTEFTGRAITSVERAGGRLRTLGTRFAAFGAALGPLDVALIGIPLTLEALNLMQKAGDDVSHAIDSLDHLQQPRSQEELRANVERARALANRGPSGLGRLAGADPLHPTVLGKFLDITAAIDRATFAPNAQSPSEVAREQTDRAQATTDELQRIKQLQVRDRTRGRPVSNLFAPDLLRDIKNTTNAARAGLLSQGQITDALAKFRVEIQTAHMPNKREVGALHAAAAELAGAGTNITDYAASLRALDDNHLTQAIQATADEVQQFGPSTKEGKTALDHLRVQYRVAAQIWGPQGERPNIKALAQARQQFLNSATQAAQSAVQDGLLFANSERERQQAYDDAERVLTGQLTVVRRTPRRTTLRRGGGTVTTYENPRRVPADAAAGQVLREQRAQLRDQRYQDEEAGRQAALALAQSRSADQVRNSRLAVDEARRQVDAARQTYGTQSRQYAQSLAALNNARQQQASAILSRIQAEGQLLTAKAGSDPAAQARAAVTAARRALSYIRSHPDKFDATALIQAQATLIQAQTEAADQIRQQALALTQLRGQIAAARAHGDPVAEAQAALQTARKERQQARTPTERLQATLDLITANNDLQDALNQREQDRLTFLESLTTDPVKQAGYEVQRAAAALKNTRPGTSAYYQAQAQYHQALQQQHQARLQSQEDDIDFELQMEKISRDEAIRRYKHLSQMHDLSKQERRDLLLKIHQLQKDADADSQGFALRVGDVKLPTVYDVRRAIGEARRGGGAQANFHNNVNLHVNVTKGADVRDVFNELDRQLSTSVSGQMRAAGIS
jgi:hypothetical protein